MNSTKSALTSLTDLITKFFILWIILFSAVAYFFPSVFRDLGFLIVPMLAVIMFAMGITLKTDDFRRVFSRPLEILTGVFAQYAVMPLLGFLLVFAFGTPPLVAAGVVLVGSCPGGTASNVITYLARGDLALSVTLTSVSTLLCPFFLPALMYVYAGRWIDVPVADLFISALQIVLLPVLLGVVLRKLLGRKSEAVLPFLPSVSCLVIAFVVGIVVALNAESIKTIGAMVFLIVIIHNALGLTCGYFIAKAMGFGESSARAISVEVGMQNSGLAVALSQLHFGYLSALPAALFSIWHNISGAVIAWLWRSKRINEQR
ncbi:MAG: bile acid:sodium symporter family protein [Candidatus Dadabacteria bacterium]|nr:bile acid:sodium symporter family protein [Candidatus Dadabacteria bacterium]